MGNLTKEEVREIINADYVKDSTFDRYVGTPVSFKEYEKVRASKYKNKNQTHNKNIYKIKIGYILLLIFGVFFLIYLFGSSDVNKPLHTDVKIMFWMDFLAIFIALYQIFVAPKKIFIKIKTDSFVLKNGREIFWDEILITGILTVHRKHSTHLILLGLDNGDVIKINFDESEMNMEDFLRIIHLNQTKEN
ncbi:MAG TPA: hypothetical protein VJL37_05400 [Flavobacterium sp.]|nr:hypothetical protein [Flavobacterium sp.]